MTDIFEPLLDLRTHATAGAQVRQDDAGVWRLSIPAGPAGRYRLAQLDDYMHLPRRDFAWRPPLILELRARASAPDLPGTWGFGFWNDPFNASLGLSGTARRLPALPNAAWFFYASPPNYLALRDSHPAVGFLAGLFSSPRICPLVFAAALPFLPLLAWPATARLMRRTARRLVQEEAASLELDVTAWHAYRLEVRPARSAFFIDGSLAFESTVVPRHPLGLVIWIDNQYAAFPPDGRLRFGTLATGPEAWLEVKNLSAAAL